MNQKSFRICGRQLLLIRKWLIQEVKDFPGRPEVTGDMKLLMWYEVELFTYESSWQLNGDVDVHLLLTSEKGLMFLKIYTGDVNQPITLSINIICKEVSLVRISTSYYACILRFGGVGEVLDPSLLLLKLFNPLSANPTKWSNTLKQFVGKSRQIVWLCLTIL